LPSEKSILQDLARRYAELSHHPKSIERRTRAMQINDLTPGLKPIVWLHEIPWHEMDIDGKLQCKCETEMGRRMEWHFRSTLFRWEYIQADTVVEDYFAIPKAYYGTGMGLNVNEDQLATDENNYIVSHHYKDQLDTMDKVQALKMSKIIAQPELDQERLDFAQDILGDFLPVKLTGHYIYHAPWDEIPRFRGVTPIMYDLMDNPELLHATMKAWTDNKLQEMSQMEALGLFGNDTSDIHCTPPYTKDLPPDKVGLKNIWFRCMAQMFHDVSPAIFKEFELDYLKPLAAQCGLTYYGCCEALEQKIDLLREIPNLRKIGVTPTTKTNVESCARQMKGDYVYSFKPNPALVATTTDPQLVRAEIKSAIDACAAHGCPLEIVLKDISTVGYKPGNIIDWVRVVMETIESEC